MRVWVGAAPSGEWELHRTCAAGSTTRGSIKGEHVGVVRKVNRRGLRRARDIMVVLETLRRRRWSFFGEKNCVAEAERIEEKGGQP